MLEGVQIISKQKIADPRGHIFHMLRRDDLHFEKFGEIYFSQILPQAIKGWHLHKEMKLNYLLVTGTIRLVLYDDRPQSKSFGQYQSIALSADQVDNKLIIIPPLIWNAFQGLGSSPSIVANCATFPHDPEEIVRKNIDDPNFNYDWTTKVDLS